MKLTDKNIAAITAICDSLVESGHKNRSGGANCVKASEVVAPLLGGRMVLVDVTSLETNQKVGIEHGVVVMQDGTIIDPTIQQFAKSFPGGWPGVGISRYSDIAVIPPQEPLSKLFQVNGKAMMEYQMQRQSEERGMGF